MKATILTLSFLLNCYLSFSQSFIAIETPTKRVEPTKTEDPAMPKPNSISSVVISNPVTIEEKTAPIEIAENNAIKSDSAEVQKVESDDTKETASNDLKATENTDIKVAENTDVKVNTTADIKNPEITETRESIHDFKSVEPVKTDLRSSDYKGMVEAFTEEILRNPDSLTTLVAYTGRAKANIELKNYKEAIADCNTVLNKDRVNEDALFNRGFAKMKSRDFRGGLNDLNKLVKMNPKNQEALFYRAVCKSYLFDNKGAIKDYTTILALDPTNTNVIFERAVLKYESYDTKGAIVDWYKIADKDPRAAKAIKKYSKELAKY